METSLIGESKLTYVFALVGTRRMGEVASAANHIGFRCVRDAATTEKELS